MAGRAADLPGAAHLTLADRVVHLDPASAVFEAMLEGWKRQQQTRFLKWEATIKPRLSLVRRFAVFTGQYPWEWEPAEVEAFFAQIRADNPGFTMSSGRQYQASLRMFMDFICDRGTGGWRSARSGSAGFRRRSCTSGTPSRTWPGSRVSRAGAR